MDKARHIYEKIGFKFVQSPNSADGAYSKKDRRAAGNGYVPISLQYGTYIPVEARKNIVKPYTCDAIHLNFLNRTTR
ncbi:MAG: hypothetical protein LBV59_24255 [Sphingobacterium sp.]|jgi:hypothetical protein|uniref:hypothetical protein n=1 Tax=Sphingobacterium sp. TaxID=341027 RepID=UPI002840A442|nr:hypothetical protein [Sphingobacterium sp.]MDR3011061.1 hypothetical protein [Sphingobacterium sp.]